MAIYELECEKCKNHYDINCLMSKKDDEMKKAKCPECNSKKKKQVFGGCGITFSNPVGTGKWNNSQTGHDYRYKWNHERPGGVKDQRETAQKLSHVGPTPYDDIDDISSGKYFGEVK